MADYKISITEFLAKSRSMPVMDVRSPAEFEHGHITGAINLPLFDNEERSIIGTLYLQKGSSEAMMKGLEMIGPKMKEFASVALRTAPERKLLLYCWRGGMRSNSMAWLFDTVGIKTHTLEGGYKSYRRYVLDYFSRPLNLIIIGGMTGSGKTAVLEAIESKGKQVIHLEKLAMHKGSVFGGIRMPDQPSTEHFENELFTCLTQMNANEPIYVEDESLAIGRVFIPQSFYEQMSSARCVNLDVPANRRVEQLVESYTGGDIMDLVSGVKRIERRLGFENAAIATECIYQGDMVRAVELVLKYYDKVYSRSTNMHSRRETYHLVVNDEKIENIANNIVNITSAW